MSEVASSLRRSTIPSAAFPLGLAWAVGGAHRVAGAKIDSDRRRGKGPDSTKCHDVPARRTFPNKRRFAAHFTIDQHCRAHRALEDHGDATRRRARLCTVGRRWRRRSWAGRRRIRLATPAGHDTQHRRRAGGVPTAAASTGRLRARRAVRRRHLLPRAAFRRTFRARRRSGAFVTSAGVRDGSRRLRRLSRRTPLSLDGRR